MVARFIEGNATLKSSLETPERHYTEVHDQCRLSREIHFKLGRPHDQQGAVIELIADLFREAASMTRPELVPSKKELLTGFKANMEARADRIAGQHAELAGTG